MTELAAPQISSLMEALPGIAAVLRSPVANAIVSLSRAGAGLEEFRAAEAEELLRYGVRRNLLTQDEVDRVLGEIREVLSHRPAKPAPPAAEKPKKAPAPVASVVETRAPAPKPVEPAVAKTAAKPIPKVAAKPVAKPAPAPKAAVKSAPAAKAKPVDKKAATPAKPVAAAKKVAAKPAAKKPAPKKR